MSSDYSTFVCLGSCTSGHPFAAYTKGRKIVISNLGAYDGSNGSKMLTLTEGKNIINYYSRDPSKI